MFGIKQFLDRVQKEQYYTKDNFVKASSHRHKEYELIIENYKTREGCWQYTQGIVKKGDEEVARIKRNYGSFPFIFVDNFLICGYDYQGHTVVDLKTKQVYNTLHEGAEKGFGFCFVGYMLSPDKKQLAVEGCYWACPYEIWIYDLELPSLKFSHKLTDDADQGTIVGWTEEGIIEKRWVEVRKSDGKIVTELSDQERIEIEDGEGLSEYKVFLYLWKDGVCEKLNREIEITGKPSGDGGCFCFEVSKDEYIRITGEEPDEKPYRIYPGQLIDKLNIPKTEITLKIHI